VIRYFLKRIILLIPVIIAVSFLVFTLMDLAPGDPLDAWDLSNMPPEDIAALRVYLGVDDPLIVRYGRYMFNLIQGDLGVGDRSRMSVWDSYMERLPNTLILAFSSFLIAVVVSIPLGIFAARRAGKVMDNLATGFTLLGMSMPGFWLGILMIMLFSYHLDWFPAGAFRDGFRSLILPAVCASMIILASAARQTRSSMLEVLKADYLRTARAKGVPESVVIRKHALGNAMLPIVTIMGVGLGISIAGTAVIETVFAWPGVGRFIIEAVSVRDVTTTTGTVILTTILYVFIQLLVDMAYALFDPRIKAQYVSAGKRKKRRKVKEQPTQSTASIEPIAPVVITDAQEVYEIGQAEETTEEIAKEITEEIPFEILKESMAASYVDKAENTAPTDSISTTESMQSAQEHVADEIVAEKQVVNDVEPITKKYRKRSQFGEVTHHLMRNPGAVAGLIMITVMILFAISSFFIPFEAVVTPNLDHRFDPPGGEFLFGTDGMGRNQFIRVIYAARFSLPIGFGATALAAVIGVLLGSLASYYEGTAIDELIMRSSDVLASIPGVLLGIVIITTLGRSVPNLIIAVGVAAIPQFIRISRASTLSVRGNEFVEAARAIGLSNFRIIFTQVLPNGLAPIIVLFTALLGIAILTLAALSFLGFGIPIPYPEWGSMVAAGRDHIRHAPWLTFFPGLFIMITVMAFNLLGDGLRDAFDPKLKKR
jgi:peptide/nickel transport system permease protein